MLEWEVSSTYAGGNGSAQSLAYKSELAECRAELAQARKEAKGSAEAHVRLQSEFIFWKVELEEVTPD